MSKIAPDMATCYDFSPIETAVQTLAETAQGDLAWLTGFEALALQKERPRIECYLENSQAFGDPPHYVNTAADNQRRINGWIGSLRTMIVTPIVPGESEEDTALKSYQIHMQYRSFAMNLLSTLDQQLGDTGPLDYHTVSRCFDAGNNSTPKPQDGVYVSQLNHNLIYAIRPTAFPGGIVNA